MPSDPESQRAIETIKLRAPIEDVVRERVPALKKSGATWKACCPFHEEKTPSFVVTPRLGLWHCFGACGAGGDVISFVQRFDNLSFRDALEILAARTGVTLPVRARTDERAARASEPVLDALERAARFFSGQMRTSEGQVAVRYLQGRGLQAPTVEAFGVGYAPASGQAFVEHARAERLDLEACVKAGLVRRSEDGRAYDFFRGRMTIPIRDVKGSVVGFGARRLVEGDEAGPKYVNSAETEVFKKSTLIYALDRALPAIRKQAHIVLVEGYTDVMAAHQCGVANVVAVLGTATTDDHAALVRRTGARRISLVFDGDEAGRKAAWKALHGLLPLEVTIDVVSLRGGDDPCDLFVREGARAFQAELELAQGWFEFVVQGLKGLGGLELSREADRVIELVGRIARPVERDSRLAALADVLGLPRATIFEQFQSARRPARPARASAPAGPAPTPAAAEKPAADPWLVRAYQDLLGAVLVDASVFPLLRPALPSCPDPELARVFTAVAALYEDPEAAIDEGAVLNALGEDPARERVVPSVALARSMGADFEPRVAVEDILAKLEHRERTARSRYDLARLLELETAHLREGSVRLAAQDPGTLELARKLARAPRDPAPSNTQHIPTEVEESKRHG